MNKSASRGSNEPNSGRLGGPNPGSPGARRAVSLRVQLCQMEFRGGDFDGNLDRIAGAVRDSEAELVVFPEACVTGFDYDRLAAAAEAGERALEKISSVCRERERGVVLPVLVRDGEHYYNRQYCIGPAGDVLATYDKIHLIGVLKEDRFLTAGTRPAVLDYPGRSGVVRMGLATCYDLRFPELFRKMVLDGGAEVLILPAQWPRSREEHFRTLVRARAIENQCVVIACNGVNDYVSMKLCGRSAVINAKGETLREAAGDAGESISLELDFTEIRNWRETFPVLDDAHLR